MSPSHLFIVSMVILTTLHTDTGTAVRIYIDPQNIPEGEKTNSTVMVSCTLDSLEDSAIEISSIKIVKNGWQSLAIAQPKAVSSYLYPEDEFDDVTAVGRIEESIENIKKSYLNMTLKNPDVEDAGKYACHVIFYKNGSNVAVVNKAKGHLAVEDPEVKAVDKKVGYLKTEVEKEGNEIINFGEKKKKDERKLFGLDKESANRDNRIVNLSKDERKIDDKVTRLKENTFSKLKTSENLNSKSQKEVMNLKDVFTKFAERIKRDSNELKEIVEKEEGDHRDVNELVVNTGRMMAEMKELKDTERNIEDKIIELGLSIRNSVKKMEEISRSKKIIKTEKEQLVPKLEIQGGYLKDLEAKERGFEKKISEMEKKVEDNISILRRLDLITEDGDVNIDESEPADLSRAYFDPMTAFAVANQNTDIEVEKRKNLVFSDVIFKMGINAYNDKTGVFVAPADGVYQFSLMIKVECVSCYLLADVMVNKKRIVLRLKVGILFDDWQGSSSSVVQLKKGDEVKTIVNSTTDGLMLSPNRTCLFSGHLVNPL